MAEDLVLNHPKKPEKTTRIQVDSRTDIGGGIDSKDRVTGHIIPSSIDTRETFDPSMRTVSLIERHSRTDLHSGADLHHIWKKYREIGLPVVPTFRVSTKDTSVTTDLKANGSEIYGKAMNLDPRYSIDKKLHGLTEADRLFVAQYPQIKAAIEQQAMALSQLATENNIILPYDDPWELIFHPNGQWELMTLDLELTKFGTPNQRFSVQMQNDYNVSDFLKNVDDVWEMLQAYST